MNNMAFGEFKVEVETTDNRGFTAEEVTDEYRTGQIVRAKQ